MAIDGRKVFIGSQNLTRTSLDERRELGWTTTDQATTACFHRLFDADWAGRSDHQRSPEQVLASDEFSDGAGDAFGGGKLKGASDT